MYIRCAYSKTETNEKTTLEMNTFFIRDSYRPQRSLGHGFVALFSDLFN